MNALQRTLDDPRPAASIGQGVLNLLAHGYWLGPLLLVSVASIGFVGELPWAGPLPRVPRAIADAAMYAGITLPAHLLSFGLGAMYHLADSHAARPPALSEAEHRLVLRARQVIGALGLFFGVFGGTGLALFFAGATY